MTVNGLANLPLTLVVKLAVGLQRDKVRIPCLLFPEAILQTDSMLQVHSAPIPLQVQISNGGCTMRKGPGNKDSRIVKSVLSLFRRHEVLEGFLY